MASYCNEFYTLLECNGDIGSNKYPLRLRASALKKEYPQGFLPCGYVVPRRRIELRTHGFSVHCSTGLSYLGVSVIVVNAGKLSSSHAALTCTTDKYGSKRA